MIDSIYIAWQYVRSNKIRTATLIACITLISFLPVSLQLLLGESERQLMSRAVSTPLVIGAKGSSLDLVMNSLYFSDEVPELISMEASERVMESGLALSIPVYVRFHARGNPIVEPESLKALPLNRETACCLHRRRFLTLQECIP
ncbi:MAG: hypothetical protein JRD87_16250 [Deltaproteobacteria bacterium]|nr:hypothetical protein [Deltaproteobacteria bacterium]